MGQTGKQRGAKNARGEKSGGVARPGSRQLTVKQMAAKQKMAETSASAELPRWNFAALAQQLVRAATSEISDAVATSKAAVAPGGKLTLVATPIGHRGDITLRALLTLATADCVLCEDTRVSGALLKAYGISRPLQPYHEHNAASVESDILARLVAGAQLALVSDAGQPLIADPGQRLVQACWRAGIAVSVCPGASAVTMALALSPLPSQPFLFAGFLPPKRAARCQSLAQWQALPATLAFYESPQRLAESLQDMAAVLGDRPAAVARELTKLYEECRCGTLAELAAYYAAHPPKGEIVVLVGPPLATEMDDEAALMQRLQNALRSQSLRDAVAAVAAASGAPRDHIYRLALKVRDSTDAADG